MEQSPPPLKDLQTIICKDFQIERFNDQESLAEMKIKLSEVISFLLNNDMNRLLNIFYRIDLNEKEVNKILSHENIESIPLSLAEMVLKREMEKVKTRIKYK